MSEHWAYCATCDRSFYVAPSAGPEHPSTVTCPVCLAAPSAIEVRDDTAGADAAAR